MNFLLITFTTERGYTIVYSVIFGCETWQKISVSMHCADGEKFYLLLVTLKGKKTSSFLIARSGDVICQVCTHQKVLLRVQQL